MMRTRAAMIAGVSTSLPGVQQVSDQVDVAGDEIFPVQKDDAHAPVPSKDVIGKIQALLGQTLSEQDITPNFLWMLRAFVQFVLMHVGTPPTIQMLPHTTNSSTLLVPAITALLKMAPVIQDQEPRALRDIDLDLVRQKRDLLEQYREMLKTFNLAAHCVEAGMTHLEQFLQPVAQTVYQHVHDLMSTNLQIFQELQALDTLMTQPTQVAAATKKNNAQVAADAVAKAHDKQAAGGAPVPVPGQGPTITVTTGPSASDSGNPTTHPISPPPAKGGKRAATLPTAGKRRQGG